MIDKYRESHKDRCYWNDEGTICRGVSDLLKEISILREALEFVVSELECCRLLFPNNGVPCKCPVCKARDALQRAGGGE